MRRTGCSLVDCVVQVELQKGREAPVRVWAEQIAHLGGHADQASSMDLREIREDYVQDSQTNKTDKLCSVW